MNPFTESVVEDAALAWLESLGYTVKHGPDIGPGERFAERAATVTKNATLRIVGRMYERKTGPSESSAEDALERTV